MEKIYKDLIQVATPYRETIITEHNPHMKELSNSFKSSLSVSNHGANVASMCDLSDEGSKNPVNKYLSKMFSEATRASHGPRDYNSKVNYLEELFIKVSTLIPILKAIDFKELSKLEEKYGISFNVTQNYFQSIDKDAVNSILKHSGDLKGEICACSDAIKVDAFNDVPEIVDDNGKSRKEISRSQFNKIISLNARKKILEEKLKSESDTKSIEMITNEMLNINFEINTYNKTNNILSNIAQD